MACSSALINCSYIFPKSSNFTKTLSFTNSSAISFRTKSLRSTVSVRPATNRRNGFVVKAYFDYRYHGTSFEQTYRCYPASFIDKKGRKMATKFVHPKLPTSQVVVPCSIPRVGKIVASSSNHHKINGNYSTITRLKADINKSLQGIDRGIFGIPSEKKSEIEDMVKQLESINPNPHSTLHLEKLGGCWKLIYSTISILGSKRTKLGLRDFISLGDFLQLIDVDKGKAVNMIMFNVRGLKMFSGKLIIEASFEISSKSRVDISYNTSTIVPEQLMNMFLKNYDILLGIFNPDGWLEITYVDETLRIGRDDKGNIFVLERSEETNP